MFSRVEVLRFHRLLRVLDAPRISPLSIGTPSSFQAKHQRFDAFASKNAH